MEKIECTHCGEENKPHLKYCFSCGYELPKTQTINFVPQKEQKRPFSKKNMVGTIVGIVAFAVTSVIVQQVFFKTPSFDKMMMKVASELNKTCPIMVDQYTRLDNAVALPGNIFQYNYTLVDMIKTEVNLDTAKKYIEPGLINNIKTNPDMKTFKDNKMTMVYYYKDKNGEFITKFEITPELYE